MAGEENLIDMSKRTKEEQRAIATAGGKKSGEARQRAKIYRDVFAKVLNGNFKPIQDDDSIYIKYIQEEAEAQGKTLTNLEAQAIAIAAKAAKGDIQAATFIRDTVGAKPVEEIDLDGGINIVLSDELEKYGE